MNLLMRLYVHGCLVSLSASAAVLSRSTIKILLTENVGMDYFSGFKPHSKQVARMAKMCQDLVRTVDLQSCVRDAVDEATKVKDS